MCFLLFVVAIDITAPCEAPAGMMVGVLADPLCPTVITASNVAKHKDRMRGMTHFPLAAMNVFALLACGAFWRPFGMYSNAS